MRQEFSRHRDDVETTTEEAMTFLSGYDLFITSKSTDRGERGVV
jgi:hypothetical protein